ncbi:hypothetical protein F5Y19DRAFT_490131 [Xylariaceae sp. FL1651]|nr:hypothetical protein F5Y19DRAFT_490131 [Xylariaceae sp. FL1651]
MFFPNSTATRHSVTSRIPTGSGSLSSMTSRIPSVTSSGSLPSGNGMETSSSPSSSPGGTGSLSTATLSGTQMSGTASSIISSDSGPSSMTSGQPASPSNTSLNLSTANTRTSSASSSSATETSAHSASSPSISKTPTPTPILPSSSFSSATPSSSALLPSSTTCSPPPADTGILTNGDFEHGLSPWSVDLVDLFSTDYALVSPGANASCTAFAVTMLSNPQTQDLRENLRLRSDLVFSLPGARLQITFYVRFAARNAARLVLSANDTPLRTVSALDYGPGGDENGTGPGRATGGGGGNGRRKQPRQEEGAWTRIVIRFTAHDRLLQLSLSYELDSASGNTIWLDQVAILPDSVSPPTSSSSPPATTLVTALRLR